MTVVYRLFFCLEVFFFCWAFLLYQASWGICKVEGVMVLQILDVIKGCRYHWWNKIALLQTQEKEFPFSCFQDQNTSDNWAHIYFRTCCACTCKDYACKHSQPKWHCHFGSSAFDHESEQIWNTPHCSCGTVHISRTWGAPPTDSVLEPELGTPQSTSKRWLAFTGVSFSWCFADIIIYIQN